MSPQNLASKMAKTRNTSTTKRRMGVSSTGAGGQRAENPGRKIWAEYESSKVTDWYPHTCLSKDRPEKVKPEPCNSPSKRKKFPPNESV